MECKSDLCYVYMKQITYETAFNHYLVKMRFSSDDQSLSIAGQQQKIIEVGAAYLKHFKLQRVALYHSHSNLDTFFIGITADDSILTRKSESIDQPGYFSSIIGSDREQDCSGVIGLQVTSAPAYNLVLQQDPIYSLIEEFVVDSLIHTKSIDLNIDSGFI